MSQRLSGNAFAFTSMMAWSTAFPATEILLHTWHPLAASVGRLFFGGIALIALLIVMGKSREIIHAPWKQVFYIGGLMLGSATICLNWGLALSNPVTAAIILTSMPAVALVMEVMAHEIRLTPKLVIGITLAAAGGAWASLSGQSGGLGFEGGEPALLASVVFFVWYSRAAVRHLPTLSATAKSGLTLSMGGLVVGVVVVPLHMFGVVTLTYDFSPLPLALMVWIACISNGASMALWMTGIERIGVTIAAIHMNMVPFYVMLLVLALGDDVSLGQTSGAVLVIAGVIISQWRSKEGRTKDPE